MIMQAVTVNQFCPSSDNILCLSQKNLHGENMVSATYMSDMSLEVFQSKGAHNKPEFERTETSAEGNLPMLNHRKKYCHYNNVLL